MECGRADLLHASAGHAGRRSGGAGARADRHRGGRDRDGPAARARAATAQEARHARPRGAAAAPPLMHALLHAVPAAFLPPLPVVVPLGVAALLLVFGHALPRHAPDVIAIATTLISVLLCAAMIEPAGSGPLVYWFGNWAPRNGLVLGIGFAVGPIDAAMGVLIGILFAAALLFAWGFFDEIHAHFQVLMLLFLAAMTGFCLTHDLFNMFVWFEVLSVAGFALTGYRLEASALEGALNFTVTNSLGSFAMLGGIGLIYAKAGALDFSALSQAVAGAGVDPVIAGAFCMVATALLIKGAMVPFHF